VEGSRPWVREVRVSIKAILAERVMDTLLSTGEVARLCGVTPDAVLKWIKKGKLPASRTVGGHYRVSREACVALGLAKSNGDEPGTATTAPETEVDRALRCWEFFGVSDAPPEPCLNCLVYQSQAQYCYRLAELCEQAGRRGDFCTSSCEECPFFRACQGMATTVLIITGDEALARRLEKQSDPERVKLCFAKSGYEGSALIGDSRPAVVVMDSGLAEVRDGTLSTSVVRDARIPGSKVFVARREGDEEAVERLRLPTIKAPFTAKQIEGLAEMVTHGRSAA